MGRSYIAFSDDNDSLTAYGKIMSRLMENGEPIKPTLVIFASDNENFGFYSRRLSATYPNATVIGSTQGLLYSEREYSATGIIVIAITDGIKVEAGIMREISKFPQKYAKEIAKAADKFNSSRDLFCLEMIATKQKSEEIVMDAFYSAIGKRNIPIVGYTAAPSRDWAIPAMVSINGEIYDDACVYAFIKNKDGRICIFKENMFKPTGQFFYATDVDVEERRVYEFDNKPASEVVDEALYKAAGNNEESSFFFPLGRIEGDDLSIIARGPAREDGSVEMFSSIYNQTRVDLLEPREPLSRVWKETADTVKETVSQISFCLVINCVSRTQYFENQKILGDYINNLDENYPNYFGISSFGEQYDFKQLNQTMLIVAFE